MDIKNNKVMTIGAYQLIIENGDVGKPCRLPAVADLFSGNVSEECLLHRIIYLVQTEESPVIMEGEPAAWFDSGPVPYRIFRSTSGEYIWIRYKADTINLVYIISKDWSTWRLIKDNSGNYGLSGFNELAYIFGYSILNKGGILFHGVVMEWNGYGIIVCAHSGVGKTTHTRMWRELENAVILNGDRALCYLQNGHWYTCGAPWCGTSGECINRSVRLSYVVVLEQAQNNDAAIIPPLQGAMELLKLTFAPVWEEELMSLALDDINNIVLEIPILKLRCRPDEESVHVLKDALMKTTAGRL